MNYKNLSFGTAGIRGIMGSGANQMNLDSIAAISHALASVMRGRYGRGKVIFCYDSRHNGKEFAECAAKIIGSYGFSVYVAQAPAPTPFLSYAVKVMDAVGGVNITASHNPKEYTGYKAYAKGGAQIDVEFAEEVQDALWALSKAHIPDFDALEPIPSGIYQQYIDTIIENNDLLNADFADFKACFTPLCGSSGALMEKIAHKANLPLYFVSPEMEPNGDFPGLPKPNPDDESVFTRSLNQGDFPLYLANDPDGDRLGVLVKIKNGFRLLTGNEIGILLLYYLLETTEDLAEKYIVKSVVSTELAHRLAESYGVKSIDVLVGFRYIAQKIANDEKNFLLGFEESGGYLAHPHAGDKDGIEAACILLKAAAYWYKQGKSLTDVLSELYDKYGEVNNHTLTLDMSIADSSAVMEYLRKNQVSQIGGIDVISFNDYAARNDDLKGNLLSIATDYYRFLLRPSGTEPKMKVYVTTYDDANDAETAIKGFLADILNQAKLCI